MDEKARQEAFMSALVTEHFVLQTGANATVSEAGTRASLYILALSSSLVAMGFASGLREVFVPFVATILPAVFLLGLFTVVRLVDAAIEYNHFLSVLRRRGQLIPDFDLLIGATALHHELTVLTINRRDFERIPGLRIYQPV
jgi:hypothetical protein